ncbi:MAG TPA: acyltransferase [Flavisolibacter sp.]|nr:acyltransferase [Flavisolibacter sp.]
MAKRYLKNLDGLRFIAASAVAITHLENVKSYALPYSLKNRFITNAPQIAVTFFFVLSGFLIMWWFLEETNGNIKKINISSFYINRISRTWPLYFLVVFASITISYINGSLFADTVAKDRYFLYLLFMPNTADVLYHSDIYLAPTWSLAVEEFFYALFPLFLVRIATGKLFRTLVIASAVFLFLSVLFNPVFINAIGRNHLATGPVHYLTIFFERYRIYAFLLGALSAAIIYFNKLDSFNFSAPLQKWMIYITGSVALFLFLFGITFSFATQQVYSVLFAFLLLLLTYRGYSNTWLNTGFFSMCGKISYGIYMLHMFIILRLANQLAFLFRFENFFMSTVVSWMLLLGLSWLLSYLSYKYFENPVRNFIRSKFIFGKERI